MRENRVNELTKKIIAGYRISRKDDRSVFMDTPVEELGEGVRRGLQILCTGGAAQDRCRYL